MSMPNERSPLDPTGFATGAANYQKKLFDMAQANTQMAFDYAKDLMAVRSPDEAVRIRNERRLRAAGLARASFAEQPGESFHVGDFGEPAPERFEQLGQAHVADRERRRERGWQRAPRTRQLRDAVGRDVTDEVTGEIGPQKVHDAPRCRLSQEEEEVSDRRRCGGRSRCPGRGPEQEGPRIRSTHDS